MGLNISWEMPIGGATLNSLRGSTAWRNCENADSSCVQQLEDYIGRLTTNSVRATQWRFSFSGEYLDRSSKTILLENPMLAVDVDGGKSYKLSGTIQSRAYFAGGSEPYVVRA